MSYHKDWYCGSCGLYGINGTGTGSGVNCRVSVGLVLGR